MDSATFWTQILGAALSLAGVVLIGVVRQLLLVDKKIAILESADERDRESHLMERADRAASRAELLAAINSHNSNVMRRLAIVEADLKELLKDR